MSTLTVNFSGGYADYQVIRGTIVGGELVGEQTAPSAFEASLRITLRYKSKVTLISMSPERSPAFFGFRFYDQNDVEIPNTGANLLGPAWSGAVSNVKYVRCSAVHPTSQKLYSVAVDFVPSGIASSPTEQENCGCDEDIYACPAEGPKPIGLYNGDKMERAIDLNIATSGHRLEFNRGFQQSKLADPNFPRVMGLGWSHSHNLFLDATTTTDVIYVYLEKGGRAHFAKQTATLYTAKAGGTSTITIDTGSTDARYTLNATDQKYLFDSTGKLKKRQWSNGEEWTYNYYDNTHFANGKLKEVLSGYAAKLQFAYYNQSGQFYHLQLRRVGDQSAANLDTTPTGRYVEYAYTQEHQNGTPKAGGLPLLTSVKDFRQNVWLYEYYGLNSGENNNTQYNWLKKYKSPSVDLDGNGTNDNYLVLKSVQYTTNGSSITDLSEDLGLIGTSNVALETVKYTFLPAEDITKEETAGRITTHLFSNGVYFGITNALNQSAYQIPNPSYRPFNLQDANGNPPTQLSWSSDGKLLNSVTDAANQTTGFTYDSQDRLATMTDAEGRVTEFSYDDVNVPRQPTVIKVKRTV